MRYFTLHIPKIIEHRLTDAQLNGINTQQVLDSAKLVREGFNWEAFFLAISWALRYRLWSVALILTAILAIFIYFPLIFGLDIGSHIILLVGFALFCGFNANDWYRIALHKNGWKLVNVIGAKNLEQAYLRFEGVLNDPENAFLKRIQAFQDNFQSTRTSVDSPIKSNSWFLDN